MIFPADPFVDLILLVPYETLGLFPPGLFLRTSVYSRFNALVSAYVITIPHNNRLFKVSVFGMGEQEVNSVMSLRANQWSIFSRVVFPVTLSSVAGGWFLALTAVTLKFRWRFLRRPARQRCS
ncbi:hypothetical protein [Halomonas sp. PBN3]|uniref:hypothetical protein n=1 Tax=unclassified Halomonas TaxID=2609666 RepID=UPI00111AA0D2|nr:MULTISPECIES: hypothetical protein [unclassified Halomonas]